jgi:hypothetical protein
MPEFINSQQCYHVTMSHFSDRKSASQSVFSGLLDWSKAHLYLSPAHVLAAVIAVVTTAEAIRNCIQVNLLELGVLAIPFIACLDILFIALVASLFVRRPSGSIKYLGFIAILIVPTVGSNFVMDALRSLSGVNNVPDAATSRLVESSSILLLSLLYFWDIVSRMRDRNRAKLRHLVLSRSSGLGFQGCEVVL